MDPSAKTSKPLQVHIAEEFEDGQLPPLGQSRNEEQEKPFTVKDFAYYSEKFWNANVKLLLKELKGSFKSVNSSEKLKKNSSLGHLDFKIAMIRAAQLKAEVHE